MYYGSPYRLIWRRYLAADLIRWPGCEARAGSNLVKGLPGPNQSPVLRQSGLSVISTLSPCHSHDPCAHSRLRVPQLERVRSKSQTRGMLHDRYRRNLEEHCRIPRIVYTELYFSAIPSQSKRVGTHLLRSEYDETPFQAGEHTCSVHNWSDDNSAL